MKKHEMLGLDYSKGNKYYYNNKFITHFLNALSTTFPSGEQFFVRSVRRFRTSHDTPLEREITRFIREEATHTIAHDIYNKYAKIHNLPLYNIQNNVDVMLKILEKMLTPKLCLAITVALEHYTASMGKEMLTNPYWLSNMDDEYSLLWKLHSIDEVAHRCVAWDVYEVNKGGYVTKSIVMLVSSIILWIALGIITANLMICDKEIGTIEKLGSTITGLYELLNPSYGFLFSMFKEIPLFFDKSYHPSMS